MRIDNITVFRYDANYRYSMYSMYHGRLAKGHKSIVVRMLTDNGIEGWAETAPLGSDYLPSSFSGEVAALKELGPQIIGLDPRSPATVSDVMDRAMACWDILGKSVGLSTATRWIPYGKTTCFLRH